MISEAAKFKLIEQTVRHSMRDNTKFIPNPTILSLENNWVNLSEQTQMALTLEGLFPHSIEISNTSGKIILVDGVQSPIVSQIALQVYRCAVGVSSGSTLPSLVNGVLQILGIVGYDKSCQILTNRTMHISGRDGLCVDVSDNLNKNQNPVILYPCHSGNNQKWTFQDDGTIRSWGK